MALTGRRWIAAAAAACGLIAATVLWGPIAPLSPLSRRLAHASPTIQRQVDSLGWQMTLERKATTTLTILLRESQVRDSVLAVAPVGRDAALRVYSDRSIRQSTRDEFEAEAKEAWAALSPNQRSVPVVVALVSDTGRFVETVRRQQYGIALSTYLPRQLGRPECLTVISDHESPQRKYVDMMAGFVGPRFDRAAVRARLLGACAYLVEFGPPGPAIERWLEANIALGLDAFPADTIRRSRLLDRFNEEPQMNLATAVLWMHNDLVRESISCQPNGTAHPCAATTNADGLLCAVGRLSQCERAIVGDSASDQTATLDQELERISAGSSSNYSPGRLGPDETSVLSDMLHTMGPARFAAMWQSTKPLPDAFRDASGESLGEWTRDWLRQLYGGTPHLGPGLQLTAILNILVTVLAALGIAIVIATRRRSA